MKGFCAAALAVSSIASFQAASAQDNPVAVLLQPNKLSNVPLKCQSKVQPGTIVHIKSGGNFDCSEPSALALTLPTDIPADPTVLSELHVGLDQGAGVALKFLKYVPLIKAQSSVTLSTDQAQFTSKAFPEKSVDALVYNDVETKKTADSWMNAGQDVYLVTTVYWTKELNISSSKAQGITLSNGDPLVTCKPLVDVSAKQKPADTDQPAVQDKGQKSPTESSDTQTKGKPKKEQDSNSKVAQVTKAVTDAATPKVEAGICRDTTGTVHLKSQTPVAVGMDVVVLGYWKQKADGSIKFDYDTPKKTPVFP